MAMLAMYLSTIAKRHTETLLLLSLKAARTASTQEARRIEEEGEAIVIVRGRETQDIHY